MYILYKCIVLLSQENNYILIKNVFGHKNNKKEYSNHFFSILKVQFNKNVLKYFHYFWFEICLL